MVRTESFLILFALFRRFLCFMTAIKVIKETDTTVTLGGYGVVFGGVDLDSETFTKDTDFQLDLVPEKSLYYDHSHNARFDGVAVGKVVKEASDDVGLWVESELAKSDEYWAYISPLIEAGRVGMSSGSVSHLVRTEKGVIKSWPIVEHSLTVTPAEPRTVSVERIKNIDSPQLTELLEALSEQEPEASRQGAAEGDGIHITIVNSPEEKNMSDETNVIEREEFDSVKAAATKASEGVTQILDMLKNAPALKDAGYIAPDDEEGKPEVKSVGDFLIAVSNGNTKRLQTVYGSTKAHDSQTGESLGYLIPDEYRAMIDNQINLTSGIVGLVNGVPVNQPSGRMPAMDYSITPSAGSGETAEAGGLGTNIRAESGAYIEETTEIAQILWRVSDALSGYVKASRELRQYAPTIESLFRNRIAVAQAAKKEHFILRGTGVGQPTGVLNWSGAIGITPDTNNTFAVADADEMLSRFVQIGGSPVWAIHPGIIPDIASMERGTGAGTFQSQISQSLATTLHGYPIVRSQHLPQDDNSGCVVLGDFSAYGMFEYGSMYVEFSEHADFLNGNDVWRFGQLLDGKPLMNSAVTLADPQGSYSLSPFVYLND